MSILTDNTKALENALHEIETLKAEKAHLLRVIKERKLSGFDHQNIPVYYISDEYDAAGFLITPEVEILK